MKFKKIQLLWRETHNKEGMAEPSEVRFRAWVLGLALVIGPPLLLILYYKLMFPGLTNADALDFAQIGRNMSAGRGFVTDILRPLALTHGSDPLHQPDVTHGPLFPFLLALAFGPLGAKDSVAAGVSGLFYVLTIPVLYLLGVRVFSRAVGLLTAVIFTFNSLALQYAASGLHITLYIFLMTSLMLVTYNLAAALQNDQRSAVSGGGNDPFGTERKAGQPIQPIGKLGANFKDSAKSKPFSKALLVLAGLLTGLLYLTDPIFFWIIPVILGTVIVLNGQRRWQATLVFLIPLCVLVLPWMARNGMLTGNPIFGLRGKELWMYTRNNYPNIVGYRMAPGEMIPGLELFQAVAQKMLFGIGQVIQNLYEVTASWMLAFFLPSLLFHFTDRAANTMRRVLISCFGALTVGMLFFTISFPVFVSLEATMLVFSVAYLLHLIQQAQLSRSAVALVTSLLSIAVVFPLVSDMTLIDKTPPLKDMPAAVALGQMSRPDEVSFSDQPAIVAWYADRPSIWIPASDEQVGNYQKQFPDTRWLFVTEDVSQCSRLWIYLHDNFQEWNKLDYDDRIQHIAEPLPLSIDKKRLPPYPLFTALDGFMSVRPADGSDPSTVIARHLETAENRSASRPEP